MASSTALLSSALAGASGAINHLSVAPSKAVILTPLRSLVCRASASGNDNSDEHLPRRTALALLAGVALVGSKPSTALAAYGESANIFGTPKQQTGFTTFTGDGFKLQIPSKWNPSKEAEFPGTVLRYEDNFDQKSNLAVIVQPCDKSSITDFGSPESFLESNSYLLGKQAYAGKTSSEGGFSPDAVATAALLDAKVKEVDGKKYYELDVLTRTADGDEGGTHQLIVGTVNAGKLYLLKIQAGDKRWFKGAQKFVRGTADSFSLA